MERKWPLPVTSPWSAQVHDDAGLLACSALSETDLQAAGGRPGSHCGLDLQPGRAAQADPHIITWVRLGERGLTASRSPVTGVSGPVNAPGPVLAQLSRHPKLYLLLGGGFCLLS